MFYVTYAAYDALGDTKYMNFVLVLNFFKSSMKTQIFSRGNITKKAFEIQAPGDSIHDQFIHKRWRSRLQPLKGSCFHHPQKGHETQNCQAIAFHMYLHCPQKLEIMKTFNLKFHPADGGIFLQSAICWLMYQ